MIPKICHTGDNKEIDRLLGGHYFTVYEDRYHIKSAASDVFTAEMLKQYAPPKGYFMGHLIGMGSFEKYGFNLNADAFGLKSLQDYHHTFVKNGHVFREHRNKDPETQGLGFVKASAVHPALERVELIIHGSMEKAAAEYEQARSGKALSFSMSCFPAGSLVRMGDGSEKPIETIQCGESVLTHKGNIGVVSHTMSRHYTGKGVKLRAYGLDKELICTEDHGIWRRSHNTSNREVEGFIGAKYFLPGDYIRQPVIDECISCEESFNIDEWRFIEKGFLYIKIISVEFIDLDEEVYDLTVPGDHGFMVHGYGVSNCKIPKDVCSCCGNKAATRAQYCKHLKYNMGKYVPEFRKYAYADNPNPNFFDISFVKTPADRIARYLEYKFPDGEKAASTNGDGLIITGADWAEFEGFREAESSREQLPLHLLGTLSKLANAERDLHNFRKSANYKSSSDEKIKFIRDIVDNSLTDEQLNNTQIGKLREVKPGALFRKLANKHVILPFESFVAYCSGEKISDVQDNPVIKYAKANLLGNIFSNMEKFGCCCCDAIPQVSPSDEAQPKNRDEVEDIMNDAEEKFGVGEKPVQMRVIRISIFKSASSRYFDNSINITDDKKELAETLSHMYGLYKLAALREMENTYKNIGEAEVLLVANH